METNPQHPLKLEWIENICILSPSAGIWFQSGLRLALYFRGNVSVDLLKASHVVLEFDETAENDKNVCFAWGPLSNSPSDSSVPKLCHTLYSFVLSRVRQEGAIQGSVTINESEIEFINYFFTSIKLITRQSEYNYPFSLSKRSRHTMKYHYHQHLIELCRERGCVSAVKPASQDAEVSRWILIHWLFKVKGWFGHASARGGCVSAERVTLTERYATI